MEEYRPELKYIPGERNFVADALSWLQANFTDKPKDIQESTEEKIYALNEPEEIMCPIDYALIQERQEEEFTNEERNKYQLQEYRAYSLYTTSLGGKIIIPPSLVPKVIEWYHDMLVHPGAHRMDRSIGAIMKWKNFRNSIIEYCKTCDVCQLYKKQ